MDNPNPTIIFHVRGKFAKAGGDVIYEGGEELSYSKLDPDVISTWDLAEVVKEEANMVADFQMYFRTCTGHGDEAWRVLCDDRAVIEFLNQYKGKDEYHVYIKQSLSTEGEKHDGDFNDRVTTTDGGTNENQDGQAAKQVGDNVTTPQFEEDVWCDEETDDSNSEFEVHPDWVSDNEVEDREEIAANLKKAKENLKKGILTTYHSDDEMDRRQEIIVKEGGFDSDDIGSHDETDGEDELADHDVRRKSNFPKFNPNLGTPFFEVLLLGSAPSLFPAGASHVRFQAEILMGELWSLCYELMELWFQGNGREE
ncbi:unnamed protein product [Linum tenue]|uniref:PB1-like domain-containing protein n=1 Tax=Linum tenue TaxID=586396 RepID=A0AAV0QK83_9ROSI|nr:unnamed protein product [Linum tenue]